MKKTIKQTKKVGRKLWTYLPDIALSLLFVFLWHKSGDFLHTFVDETAATPDAAFLLKFLFGAMGVIAMNLTVKIVMFIAWSKLDHLLETRFSKVFENDLTEKEQLITSLAIYGFNCLMFVLLVMAI